MRRLQTSLAARTTQVLLGGLLVTQVGGLSLHALDRAALLHAAQESDLAGRAIAAYRSAVLAQPEQRAALLDHSPVSADLVIRLSEQEPTITMPLAPAALQDRLQAQLQRMPLPQALRPASMRVHSGVRQDHMIVALQLPEDAWLTAEMFLTPLWPWHSGNFMLTFLAMSFLTALLALWAVRRLILPVGTLAAAAEALGRDVNAPPLPETGPAELATAAAAFNTMAARIRRFIDDRTFLLTAIGHDLRTPITRLRLRAEFMEDEDQRRRMVADLDELEAMVAATLAFGRDATLAEPAGPIDLAALVATVLSEAADARPALGADATTFTDDRPVTVTARPVALKRALTNLVANALNYGGSVHVTLLAPACGMASMHIDDTGAGIAAEDIERVFLPFLRLEASRNRETGGVGLGLPIARNILRAHGGDVVLANRPGGGLRALVTLPA